MPANMNQIQIATIVQVIDDYFLLFDPDSGTTVKASKESSDSIDGLIICRNLRNGFVKIFIGPYWQSKESVVISYHRKGSKNERDEHQEITKEMFSLESITNAIRKIISYDSQVQNPKKDDAVLSPNSR